MKKGYILCLVFSLIFTCSIVNADTLATDYIKNLNEEDLFYDKTSDNNLRYIGENPNNYISFNGENWRIIGVMNNIDDGTGKKETRLKLVRPESIGKYSWDTSLTTEGINDWTTAKLMKLLNAGFDDYKDYSYENRTTLISLNNSLYWTRTSGKCLNMGNEHDCDFTKTGLTDSSKKLIGNSLWALGGMNNIEYNNAYTIYNEERESKVYSNHATKWIGTVALIYPSDILFATGDKEEYSANVASTEESYNFKQVTGTCINIGSENYGLIHSPSTNCFKYDWLAYDDEYWTLSPNYSNEASVTNCSKFGLYPYSHEADSYIDIYPSVYLKSNVAITGGTGTQDNPYTIDLASNCYYDESNSTYVWTNANQSNYKINDTISSKESCMSLNKEEEISNPQTGIKRINIIYILLTIPLFVIIMMLRKFKKFRN